jgi:SAM-dependent methyltransferase
MKIDIRDKAAHYYDYNPGVPDDIHFYIDQIPSQNSSILELGCGTCRVTMRLAPHCRLIYGIDLSEAMLAIGKKKLVESGISSDKAQIAVGNICDFDLEQFFDLIIAPFRVLQNIESDSEVEGLFHCLHKHLAPGGTCILNVFNPNRDRETLRREWCSDDEELNWETLIKGGKISCSDRKPRMDKGKLILYPELIYRQYEGDRLTDETVLKLVMRCYYPDDFEKLITSHGFKITGRWGGYQGEPYGEGPELVLKFTSGTDCS